MKKKLWTFVIVILALVATIFLIVENKESRMEKFVINNKEALQEIAQSYLTNEPSSNTYKQAKVDGLFYGENKIVQFSYLSFGVTPACFQNTDNDLTLGGKNEWRGFSTQTKAEASNLPFIE